MNAGNSENKSSSKAANNQHDSTASEYYHEIFDCLPDGVILGDAAANFIDVNATLCQMLGYSCKELQGKHVSNIVIQAQAKFIAPALQEINAKGSHCGEWQLQRCDGSTLDTEVNVRRLSNGNLLGVVRDITDRKLQTTRRLHSGISDL